MKTWVSNAHPVQKPIAVFLVMLTLATGLSLWGMERHTQANEQYRQARQNTLANEQRQRSQHAAEQIIASGKHLARQFSRTGANKQERRLNLIESLERIRHHPFIHQLAYSFPEPKSSTPVVADQQAFSCIKLNIRLSLLHEQILLDVIDQLKQEINAIPVIRQCLLKRNTSESESMLAAECDIDWYFLETGALPQ
ncbi:hypothetical protein KI614_12840 [Dechloromonas denitrificans]|uniref:hypothetical protein n=1 Tax=Dechloromonas denitrificans TaxID=281362 RepID=UPI001CF817CD|nr:hypothetical protein [Dechloromonas denitrificans]UCV11041.1 hypothetical protein KI614_12840 [Dechloromonas denitrificans]